MEFEHVQDPPVLADDCLVRCFLHTHTQRSSEQFKAAKVITIVGGGPAGVEMAAEILEVRIVVSNATIHI